MEEKREPFEAPLAVRDKQGKQAPVLQKKETAEHVRHSAVSGQPPPFVCYLRSKFIDLR